MSMETLCSEGTSYVVVGAERPTMPRSARGHADVRPTTPYGRSVNAVVQQRVAAMLAAYEAQSIDADELHGRLLKAIHAVGSTGSARERLGDLLSAVDEATDLGRDEREVIAWAARFWRGTAEDS